MEQWNACHTFVILGQRVAKVPNLNQGHGMHQIGPLLSEASERDRSLRD